MTKLILLCSCLTGSPGDDRVIFENGFTISTVKILKFGTPHTIAIIVLKNEKFDVTLH